MTYDSASGLADPGPDGAPPPRISSIYRRRGLLTAWRYVSANVLLALGAASLLLGGFTPFLVIAAAMVFASFADEAVGDDRTTLSDSARTFYNANLYLSLPLICVLAVLFVFYLATRSP